MPLLVALSAVFLAAAAVLLSSVATAINKITAPWIVFMVLLAASVILSLAVNVAIAVIVAVLLACKSFNSVIAVAFIVLSGGD